MAQADLGTLGNLPEDQARERLEALRWPQGAVCPKCGTVGEAYKLTPKPGLYTGHTPSDNPLEPHHPVCPQVGPPFRRR